MKKINTNGIDKAIKDFFSTVLVFLKCELNKPGTDKKAIEHNISCMLMFRSNPAKFTKPEEIKINELFITPDGLGNELFDIVKQMISVVCVYYNVESNTAFRLEKRIPQLYRQSKLIIIKKVPLYALKQIIFNKHLDRVY